LRGARQRRAPGPGARDRRASLRPGARVARRRRAPYSPAVPAVSVLLPVRDASPWLGASLASLWRQSFADFEVLAVDDGSTDGSGELLERAARRESRLRVFHTPHRGLPRAIAAAHRHARAPLLARHDADDLSHRERFALQVAFLRAHPRVAVLGTRLRLFPAGAVRPGMRRWVEWHNALLEHHEMAREVLVESPLAHGTALLRRSWVERVGGWLDRGWPEDLDLWIRLLEAGARFAKLPRALYGWRQHATSATWRDPAFSRERVLALKYDALARGLLKDRRELTLVGVGSSLRAGSTALARRGLHVRALERGRPAVELRDPSSARGGAPGLCPPIVLVFGAPLARRRWREALTGSGMIEGRDFAFMA
jgi:GT2 family glycosyltransferase